MRRSNSSLTKAFQILGVFSPSRPELGASELALSTGLDRTTIHRFLTTLAEIGVLTYNPERRKYRLGLRLLDFSFALLDSMELLRVAVPHMLRVQRETGRVVTLGVPDGADVIIVERFWGQEMQMGLVLQTGTRVPMYATAMGHCFLAYQPPEVVPELLGHGRLEPLTPKTLTDGAAIAERLEVIRERGFEISDEELFLGARAVAVPVWGAAATPVSAVALLAEVRTTSTQELVETYGPMLRGVGAEISFALGGRPNGWNASVARADAVGGRK